jgi:hypothetical protein
MRLCRQLSGIADDPGGELLGLEFRALGHRIKYPFTLQPIALRF